MKKKLSFPILIFAIASPVIFAFQNCSAPEQGPNVDTAVIESENIASELPGSVVGPVESSRPDTVSQEQLSPQRARASSVRSITQILMSSPTFKKEVTLRREWLKVRDRYRQWAKQGAEQGSVVYDLQGSLSAFVEYAIDHNKTVWIEELMEIYQQAIPAPTKSLNMMYPVTSGVVPGTRNAILNLTHPARIWRYKSSNPEVNLSENIISSSQFLNSISSLLYWAVRSGQYRTNAKVKEFVLAYMPVALKDHYLRWVLNYNSPVGSFQLTGWGCSEGNYSHYQHLQNIKKNFYKATPTYCRAVFDKDLWIISGVAYMNAVYVIDPQLVLAYASPAQMQGLQDHLVLGLEVFNSRLAVGSAKDFKGELQETFNFDPGMMDKHPDYAYAGDKGSSYPGISTNGGAARRPKKYAVGVGWDISHARRWVHFLKSLERTAGISKVIQLDQVRRWQKGFANQLAYVLFSRNYQNPVFKNYFDGTDGWYRVNYEGRLSFGHGPSDPLLSESIPLGAYGLWDQQNSDVGRIVLAGFKKLSFQNPYFCLQALSALPERFFDEILKGPKASDGSVCLTK